MICLTGYVLFDFNVPLSSFKPSGNIFSTNEKWLKVRLSAIIIVWQLQL